MKFPLHHVGIIRGFKNTGLKKHYGLDLGWHEDKHPPVYSIASGTCVYYKKQPKGGYALRIKHNNGAYSEYGHLQKGSIKIKVGDRVKMYQEIARMGDSGICSGPHLHLTIYFDSYKKKNMVDPLKYLCLYDDQEVTEKTKKNYKIYYTKKVKGTDGELAIRNKPSIKGKVVGKAKEGSQVESFGTKDGWNIVDNIKGYYCSNKYLK